MRIWLGIYLCWISFQDIREKAVSVWKLLLGALGVIIWRACTQRGLPYPIDLLPGVLCLLAAVISGEQIGYGDGMVLLLTGMCCGWQRSSCIAFGALVGAALWGIGKGCLRKRKRNERVAWLPFFTAKIDIFFYPQHFTFHY